MELQKTDPEFMERFRHFAFDEVVKEENQQLDAPTRYLAILAALIGCGGVDAFREMLPAALKSSRDFVTQVENEIRAAKSYEELEEALAALLSPSMAPDALESFLARAMTMAAGHGAASVQTEADEDG